jgi:hypothetical protein
VNIYIHQTDTAASIVSSAFDVGNTKMLTNASAAPQREAMKRLGSPFLFGTDYPEDLVAQCGWPKQKAVVVQTGTTC